MQSCRKGKWWWKICISTMQYVLCFNILLVSFTPDFSFNTLFCCLLNGTAIEDLCLLIQEHNVWFLQWSTTWCHQDSCYHLRWTVIWCYILSQCCSPDKAASLSARKASRPRGGVLQLVGRWTRTQKEFEIMAIPLVYCWIPNTG